MSCVTPLIYMEYAAEQFIDGISFVASLGYMQYAADDHVDDMSYIIASLGCTEYAQLATKAR